MASVALIGLVCLSSGFGPQFYTNDHSNLIKNGKGAYEDYVLAAERTSRSVCRTLLRHETASRLAEAIKLAEGAEPFEDPENAREQREEIVELRRAFDALPRGPGRPTALDYDRAMTVDFAPSWSLILRGNQKQRLAPRSKIDVTTTFPEFAGFRSLTRFAVAKARVEFADGNAAGAIKTYRELYRFIQRIGSETVIARLVTIGCEAVLFAEIERNLAMLPSNGLIEFVNDLRESISGSPRMRETLSVERELFYTSLTRWPRNLNLGN